ncbi:THO complex subunit 7 homolog [Styela clava]
MATDDEVIRKRLLIDGDGGGDERRFTTLMKLFMKWCNTESSETDHQTLQRMLSILSQSEFAMTRATYVHEMNKKQMRKYEKIQNDIDNNVELAHHEIEKCKNDLEKAKLVRKNRQEYDALATIVLQHPDRKKTSKELEDLNKELEELTETERKLDGKLVKRRKQFHALLTSIHHLRETLEEDEIEDQEMEIDQPDSSMDAT